MQQIFQILRDKLHRLRSPVRVVLQVKRGAAQACFALHQERTWVENAHTRAFQPRLELEEGRVLERRVLFGSCGEFVCIDSWLHRHRHHDQIDSARRELIPKIDDGFDRIGLHPVDCVRRLIWDGSRKGGPVM